MPKFDINNFVIDRVRRGVMFSTDTGEALWSLTQVEDPSLKMTSETGEAVDALGTTIMQFDRSKACEFSGSNSLFDLSLLAAQSGTEKQIATTSKKLTMEMFEEIEIPADSTTVTLKKAPIGTGAAGIPFIYKLKGDSTFIEKFEYGSDDTTKQFTFSGATLTFPTSLEAGDEIFVSYSYEADGSDGNGGVIVENNATEFAKAGKFVMEVIGCDVCNASKKYFAYVVLPQAKLKSDFDLSFKVDGKHPFTIEGMQQYCDRKKKLFYIAIPEID